MRHSQKGRKFGRVTKQRIALLRSLASSLILHERIETTEAKAKELRPFIEKLISLGRAGSVSNRRLILSRLGEAKREAHKIVDVLGPRYEARTGGYTRITRIGFDKAGRNKAVIEFVT